MSRRGSKTLGMGRLRHWIQVLRDDLWTARADPLPPFGQLRRLSLLPHTALTLTGIVITVGGTVQLLGGNLPTAPAVLVGLAQGGAVVLSPRRPIPAWWLSTGGAVLGAVAVRLMGESYGSSGFHWPWTQAGTVAQSLVLLLLALRVRPRVGAEALLVTAVVTCALDLFYTARAHYTTAEALVLFTIVVVVGVALRGRREARAELGRQNTLTEEERAQRMLLEERNRIARELHDVVAHHMSVISIQAQVATHLVDNPSDELKESHASMRQNALEALTELRQVLGVLRSEQAAAAQPVDEIAHSPQPTLDRLSTLVDNTRASGLTVTVDVLGERRSWPPAVELSAYRIVQEALSNVLRHAPGSKVGVCVEHDPDGLCVRVFNTQPERPAPPSPGAGQGLLGMHERVAMLGGSLTAHSLPDGGYEVSALLPASPSGAGSSPRHENETV